MEQSPSWEANRFSATQEIPRILWNPTVRYRIHNSLLPKGLVRIRGSCIRFGTWLRFYGEELLAPRPPPKLEDHPLSAVRDCLFNILAAALHIWRPLLHPQPEDAPCRGDRDPLITALKRIGGGIRRRGSGQRRQSVVGFRRFKAT